MLTESSKSIIIFDNCKNKVKNLFGNTENQIKTKTEEKKNEIEKVQSYMKIPKGNKTEEELEFLYNFFLSYKFFNSGVEIYGKNVLLSLLDSCELLEAQKKEIIINVGDTVKNAFILINGKIKISSNNPENSRLKTSNKLNKALNLFLYKTFKNINNNLKEDIGEAIDKLQNKDIRFSKPKPKNALDIEDDWFVTIGDLFGDKCLLERKTSTLSYTALVKSILLKIKKKDFYSLLEPQRKEEYYKDLKFYHSISVFTKFSRNAIEKLKFNLKEKKYFNGEVVIEQNKPIDTIFIVKSGSFQVAFRLKKNIVNHFNLNYYSNITPIDFRFTENRKYEIRGFKKTEENLKLLTIEKGQFIGDLEFIHKHDKSNFTVTSLHEEFKKAFEKHIKDQKDDLSEFTKEREYFYKERLKNLNAFSKNFCFDNPETKYINELINRIKEGMEYVKIQERKNKLEIKEKNQNENKYENSNYSEALIKDEKSMKTLKNKYYTQKISSKNIDDDFLKNYNRSGSFSEILKKIKIKNIPIKSPVIDESRNEKKKFFKKLNKKGINQISKSENDFTKSDNNNTKSIILKSHQKIIIKNNDSKICNNHLSRDNISKCENEGKSLINNTVKKLFSHIRSVSAFDTKLDNNKDNKDSIKKDFSFCHNDKNSINLSLRDSSIYSPSKNFISSFNSNILKKNDSMNFGESVINRNNSSFKTFLESANIKNININKDKCYSQKLVKRNASFFTYKAKIKKADQKDCKNDNIIANSSIKTIDFSLNFDTKDEKFINGNKSNFVNKKYENQSNSQTNKLNKTTYLKSEEKTKLNINSIINNNSNIHGKISINNLENFETINSNLYSNRINFIDTINNKKETYNSLEGNIKANLDPLNREIGELNNEIYMFKKNYEKQAEMMNKEDLLNSKIQNFKHENEKRLNVENSKNFITSNDKNTLNELLVANQEEIGRIQRVNNVKLDHSTKYESSIRGIFTACGNSNEIDNFNLREFWRAKRSEIFNRSDKKNETIKDSIMSSNINPNFKMKKEECEKSKDMYYVNNNTPLRSKSLCNNNDIQLNVNLFIKENFNKENSLFNTKGIKTVLECSELNKNIFVNSDKISIILNKKYDFFKKLNLNGKLEKSIKNKIAKNQ